MAPIVFCHIFGVGGSRSQKGVVCRISKGNARALRETSNIGVAGNYETAVYRSGFVVIRIANACSERSALVNIEVATQIE